MKKELKNLKIKRDKVNDELEFSTEDLAQIDAIENSVYNLCCIMLDNPDLCWDMSMIGDIADAVADILVSKGWKVHYPAIIEDDNHNELIVAFHQK